MSMPDIDKPGSRTADYPIKGFARKSIEVMLNGIREQFAVSPMTVLLDLLRVQARLTGAKRGCETGNCGACTISLDGKSAYSCLVLASECNGCEVITVEGLVKGGALHPLEQAFIDTDAFQCGYCTSGQLMSLSCLMAADHNPNEAAIVRAISGNLCRCGAYRHIRDAALQVSNSNRMTPHDDSHMSKSVPEFRQLDVEDYTWMR